jgi:hypothetical protein
MVVSRTAPAPADGSSEVVSRSASIINGLLRRHYRDLRLIEPGAPARGALAGPGKAIGSEDEPALLAPCRLDDDTMAGGLGRTNRMPEIIFDIPPIEPQLARERRD